MTNKEDDPLFENLHFNPFDFEPILLDRNQDPDEHFFESLKNKCSYFTPSELKVSLENTHEQQKSFSIISFNIRSMKKHFEEFRDFLTDINYEFSVICLTETWCLDDPRNESLFKLNNYTSIHQARKGERNGGGTCIFIHNSLCFNERVDLCVNNNDMESLSVEIINKGTKNIIVNVTYRQPAGDMEVFEKSFKNILSLNNHNNKSIYLTGDFNLNLIDYKSNAKVKSYLNTVFFIQLYSSYK